MGTLLYCFLNIYVYTQISVAPNCGWKSLFLQLAPTQIPNASKCREQLVECWALNGTSLSGLSSPGSAKLTEEGVQKGWEPKGREEFHELLSSGQVMAVGLTNSLQLWLCGQDQVTRSLNILAKLTESGGLQKKIKKKNWNKRGNREYEREPVEECPREVRGLTQGWVWSRNIVYMYEE